MDELEKKILDQVKLIGETKAKGLNTYVMRQELYYLRQELNHKKFKY